MAGASPAGTPGNDAELDLDDAPLPSTEPPEWVQRYLPGATGRGVRVAVVDSGCDPSWNHPRIGAGIGLSDTGLGFDLVPSDDVDDRIGHGTACCDILLGMAPGVEVVPVRVFGSRLETSPKVILAALEWAIEQQVDVVNLSLGSLLESSLRPFYRVCERARSEGLVVVSAGSLETGWSYPAIFENTLGVSAGRFDNIYDFNYLTGQGLECRAQADRQVRWLGGERRVFGSSFAAPHISALVALILERHPGLDLDEVRSLLSRFALR